MIVTEADIRAAAARIAGTAHRTPVMTSRLVDAWAGAALFAKCENLQRVGAFKFRGALNAVLTLDPGARGAGVAAHSSGNHAAALALAARVCGVPAHVVMPTATPAVKQAAVAGYGARITLCEPTLAAREAALAEVVARTGATEVHPYDDDRVIAGAGTAALELVREVAGLQAVVVPVGGGGLLSGTCVAVAATSGADVWGAEPAGADDAHRSLQSGVLVPSVEPRTMADGLLTSLSERTFGIISAHARGIRTVSEDEIVEAMRMVWERMKLVVEPSAAVAVAAARLLAAEHGYTRIGVVLTGGNVDLGSLPFG